MPQLKRQLEKDFSVIYFDLDGTIVDTEPVAARVTTECFAEWGIEVKPEDAQQVSGRTWNSALEHLFSKYPPSIPISDATHQIMSRYKTKIEKEVDVVPGALDAIRSLSRRYSLALVSGSRREEILLILRKLGIQDRFRIILGAEDYPNSKPSPDGYLRAMAALRATPDKGLVFEDSHAGIQAARSAHLWVVSIGSTNHFRQDLSSAHRQIPDFLGVDTDWTLKLAHEFLK